MITCQDCIFRKIRKSFTGPSRRYDYNFQNICSFGLKNINSYAKVAFKHGVWSAACENYKKITQREEI